MIKGLAGFLLLVAITFGWMKLNLIEIHSWLAFLLNSLIIGAVLITVTFFLKFDQESRANIYKKLKVIK